MFITWGIPKLRRVAHLYILKCPRLAALQQSFSNKNCFGRMAHNQSKRLLNCWGQRWVMSVNDERKVIVLTVDCCNASAVTGTSCTAGLRESHCRILTCLRPAKLIRLSLRPPQSCVPGRLTRVACGLLADWI